ncbi:hypothetical protein EMPS_07801 [Entomortierella parvispora]|uniref:Uncharacterized protein n=1 Tax=Entomortierella parvispora TaxID=205924 RepID=A0A9P3LYS8_9FUNG|nr:hypothetical protein EMPS_07801 [Entomortierella parvispora]
MRSFTVTLLVVTLAALVFGSVAAADQAQQKPRFHPSLKTLSSYPWKALAVGPYPSSYKPRTDAAVMPVDVLPITHTRAETSVASTDAMAIHVDVLLITHISVEPTVASMDATVK